jgi:alkylation response protein AidB-like acyl-CoA dehydrogenase
VGVEAGRQRCHPARPRRRAPAAGRDQGDLADQRTVQLAGCGLGETIDIADAAATKVFSTERIQRIGRLAEEIVGKYGNPAESQTAELLDWLDKQTKRNLVITFGGGVNEVMREQVAASGLKVPRVPR